AHHNAHFASGTCDTLSSKAAALLVPRQNRTNAIAVFPQGLMQRHAGAARVRINRICAKPHQHLDQDLSPIDGLNGFFFFDG
ncbi:MAG: hypothetical protein RLZZ458_208, partial [Planctomycetota bacterium]